MMNLFICGTPLQLLIARQIIVEEKITEFDLIYLEDPLIERNYFYLQQLKLIARNLVIIQAKYLFYGENILTNAFIGKMILKKLGNHYNNLYFSNIDNIFYYCLISKLREAIIFTYDDGTANINKNSTFYDKRKMSFIKKLKYRFFYGITVFPDEIRNKIALHYTIFKCNQNIIQNVKYIELFEIKNKETKVKKKINIFVGTVYAELTNNSGDLKEILNRLHIFIKDSNIDLYIPHPRDEKIKFGCKTLIPQKITEEVIIDFVNDGYEVYLYGIGSTVLFNLLYVDNINVFFMQSIFFSEEINKLSELDIGSKGKILII